ncbi:MAG: bifunctional oligoribonuclease/PAP phosphatase NrnA [Candidatus Komeilibacteria bacterium]
MAKQSTSEQIKRQLQVAKKIAIIGHQNPDGDALGALLAFYEILKFWQKKSIMFCTTPASQTFEFLNNFNQLIYDPTIFFQQKFDTIVVLDSGSLSYAGIDQILASLSYTPTIINIDHHQSNDLYGEINFINTEASSTCEIVFELARQWQVPINKDMATALLNGIVTDTSGLTNPATTDRSLLIAGLLMRYGANFKKISAYNVRTKEPKMLKIWGLAMQRIVYDPDLHSITTYLTQKDFADLQVDENNLEGLSNFLSGLKDINFTLLLIEKENGLIRGSFRTIHDHIDVGSLAASLGGGGHQKASGFVIKGKLAYNNGEIMVIQN